MPYTRPKTKKQPRTRKRTMNETVKQKKRMQGRLMVISLKADDYIYKKKPISIQEADMYVREMEAFRDQCQDERYIQVIEKLTKYMQCIIREQSPKEIVGVNILSPIGNSVEEINNENEQIHDAAAPEYNAIIDTEMEQSLSNLSIVDRKDPLAISATNDNVTYQKKAKVDHSASAITKESLNEVKHQKFAYTNKESDVSDLIDSNQQSQNILSNFEYENYTNLGNLPTFQNYKISENKQNLDNVTYNIINYSNTKIGNNTGNIHTRLQEVIKLNGISTTDNTADTMVTGYSNMNTENRHKRLQEVNNLSAIKQKELDCDSNKLSQKIQNHFDCSNHTVAGVHNNPINYQPLNTNKIPDNIIDARYRVINFNKANTGNSNKTSKFNDLNAIVQREKELGGESIELSQNLRNLENKTNSVVVILNTDNTDIKNYQTQQIPETHFTSRNDKFSKANLQDNTIFRNNTQNIYDRPKKIQHKMANDSSQNQENVIGKVKRRNVNKDIVKSTKKRTYNRKNKDNAITARNDITKEETVYSAVQDAKNLQNFVNNSMQKNQRTISKNKRDDIDISWVENMKFVRAIETDEYFKIDNLEESFWTDLSLPSNISLTDFEYDNINIWKN